MKFFVVAFASLFLISCETLVTRSDLKDQEQKKQLQDVQKTSADAVSRIYDFEDEFRKINGRIDVVENRVERGENDRKAESTRNAELQAKLQTLQEAITKLESQLVMAQAEAAKRAEKPELVSEEKKSQFDVADELFQKKNWKRSALAFQKFKESRPKDKRVPEAILKTGICFLELNMPDEAKAFFDELIEKYPNSSEAKKARARLKSMKK
jgi:TolA-binding protein